MDYNRPMTSEPLILLHGWGMHARVFEPLLVLLEDRFPTVSPCLPGYADSPWRFDSSFAMQIRQMGRDLPCGRLLGWSLGGIYALELALRYPQKFSQVTLVASNPCFIKQSGWDCALDAEVLNSFAKDLEQDKQRTLRRFLALQMQGESDARVLGRKLWQQIVAAGEPEPAVLRFGLEMLRRQDYRVALDKLVQPLKLILGERDRLVPIALGQQIADIAPGIQVESVAGAAHAPFLSNPTEVAAQL